MNLLPHEKYRIYSFPQCIARQDSTDEANESFALRFALLYIFTMAT